jgi:hypothetical protein
VTSSAINLMPGMLPSSFSLFVSRMEATTFQPFVANSFAVARPKPEELPVIAVSQMLSRILTEANGSISMRYAAGERSPEGLGVNREKRKTGPLTKHLQLPDNLGDS